MVLKYGQLRNTHPRLGKAMFGRWLEYLTSESWGGAQVVEILQHDETRGRCEICGAPDRRQYVVERVLVGDNRGQVFTSRSVACMGTPSCGSQLTDVTG